MTTLYKVFFVCRSKGKLIDLDENIEMQKQACEVIYQC